FKDVADLHAAMSRTMHAASDDEKTALLHAHPELAGREAKKDRLTAASKDEQGSAGLDRLPAVEFRRLAEMNAAYRAKFGFPFIIAVRARNKDQIFAEFARRLERDAVVERAAALAEVETIARIRLDRHFDTAGKGK
ncbi:MAG: 2-oxo-4-hydroxy-4-carboxy-5-ureidoimidazoline decarboxylase, partial [Alphaproteobacteria bacterium]